MYCSACGKQVPDNSKFCMHCGHKLDMPQGVVQLQGAKSQTLIEYEYSVISWPPAAGKKYIDFVPRDGEERTSSAGEVHARQLFWDRWQSRILPVVQERKDAGWIPISEIGPGCMAVTDQKPGSGFMGEVFASMMNLSRWYLTGIEIKVRRPKR